MPLDSPASRWLCSYWEQQKGSKGSAGAQKIGLNLVCHLGQTNRFCLNNYFRLFPWKLGWKKKYIQHIVYIFMYSEIHFFTENQWSLHQCTLVKQTPTALQPGFPVKKKSLTWSTLCMQLTAMSTDSRAQQLANHTQQEPSLFPAYPFNLQTFLCLKLTLSLQNNYILRLAFQKLAVFSYNNY